MENVVTCINEIALLEFNFGKRGFKSVCEISGLWQHLVCNTYTGNQIVLSQVMNKMSANEAYTA